jgi:hypothetical protein
MFLGEKPTLPVVLALLPIIGGVVLASTSELSFTWKGFLSAMGSNVTFQSRNVLSKKLMTKGKGALDSINTFSIITILSFLLLTPIALLTDGLVWTPAALAAAGVDSTLLAKRALLSAFAFHAYQQVRTLTCLSGTRGRMAARPAAGQLLPAQDLALDTPPRRCRWHRLPQAAVLPIASLKSMHVLPLALPAHPNPARRCRT